MYNKTFDVSDFKLINIKNNFFFISEVVIFAM